MKFFRRLLELWARGKIFTRTLVVHGQPYPIKISPDAQLKYMKLGDAKFDCDLVDIAEAFVQENSIVWDVGANVGVFTFTALKLIHGIRISQISPFSREAFRKKRIGHSMQKLRSTPIAIRTSGPA